MFSMCTRENAAPSFQGQSDCSLKNVSEDQVWVAVVIQICRKRATLLKSLLLKGGKYKLGGWVIKGAQEELFLEVCRGPFCVEGDVQIVWGNVFGSVYSVEPEGDVQVFA